MFGFHRKGIALSAIFAIIVMAFSSFIQTVTADTAQPASDTITRNKISLPVNHTIKFKTPSGVDASSDTITINLGSFTAGSVGTGDVDLFQGPTTGLENPLTHGASAAAGQWGIGVTANIITLTPPTDAAPGTVPTNNFFTVYIGTHASGGVNQITNPATKGSYEILIRGGFGDRANIALAITEDDQMNVTATVPSLQPSITSISPTPVTVGGANFVLTVNGQNFENASVVRINGIGRITTFVSATQLTTQILASDIATVGTRTITVYNPTPALESNGATLTIQGSGGGGEPPPPPPPPGQVLPVIFNIQVIQITDTSVRITWETNVPTDSFVEYGLDALYGQSVSNGSLVTSHGLDLTGLTPDTVYHFKVKATDALVNWTESPDETFKTLPYPPLTISNTAETNITDTSAVITWDTNRAATTRIIYGTAPNQLNNTANGVGFSISHLLSLQGLSPNTVYYYQILAEDQIGQTAQSAVLDFKTLGDQTPPANGQLQADGGNAIVNLIWTPPLDPDYAGVRIVARTDGFPTGPFDGRLVFLGNATTMVDNGRTNGVTYYYSAYAYDTVGNFASGALDDATPTGPIEVEPPIPPIEPPPPSPPPPAGAPCQIVCEDLEYDLYIVNPDGTERHMNSAFARIEELGGGVRNIFFEDKGEDMDLNDVVIQVEKWDCGNIRLEFVSFNADWHHQVWLHVFYRGVEKNLLIWPDSHQAQEVTVNIYNYPELVICEVPPPMPPIPPTETGLAIQVLYYGSNGTLLLTPDTEGVYGTIASDRITIRVPIANLGQTVSGGTVTILGQTYALTLNEAGTELVGTITAPPDGTFVSDVRILFEDGQVGIAISPFSVESKGSVVESRLDNQVTPVESAEVTLYEFRNGEWVVWDGTPYGQQNPLQTDAEGNFVFQVPKGTYYVEAKRDGYVERQSGEIDAERNVIGGRIEIIAVPGPAEGIGAQLGYAVLRLEQIIRTPALMEGVEITVPLLLGVSILNSATAFSLLNLLAYLQYLFTQPILLFGRLRKQRWGIVYNSLTKQAIEFAIVRLRNYETQMIVQSKVTDRQGRYVFQVKKGNYLLEVTKLNYAYPTKYLRDQKDDVVHADIYHKELIAMEEDGPVALNVPLDPIQPVETPKKVIYRRFMRQVQHGVALAGVVLSLIAFIIAPTVSVGVVAIIQLVFYYLFRRLALAAQAPSWGRIYDKDTGKAITRAVVRIFDSKFNKLLETQVTGRKGRYGFFADHNLYYITVEKEGYAPYRSDCIDLVAKTEAVVDMNVALSLKK